MYPVELAAIGPPFVIRPVLSAHRLKKALRLPVRQTEAYLRAIAHGGFRNPHTPRSHRSATSWLDAGRHDRKGVLILDYCVPMPDRGAGWRLVFEHIVSLIELNYDVYFWPADGLDVPQYARPLREMGVRIVSGYFRPSFNRWLAASAGQIHFVLLHRPEVADAYLDTLRLTGLPIIYYGHDLHFARLGLEAASTGDLAVAQRAEAMKLLERSIWRRVNLAAYPAAEETERVSELEPQVLARPILAYCFDHFRSPTAVPRGSQVMFLGGFGHTPNVGAAEFLVNDVFPLVRADIHGANLVVAGSNMPDRIRRLVGQGITTVGWLTEHELDRLYRSSRVVVVPLLFGAGVKLKVVEAMANGVPVVTTAVGAQGLPGLEAVVPICASAPELASAIVRIIRMSDREWLSQAAGQVSYVEQHFSRDAMKRSLSEAMDLAASTPCVE